MSTHTQYWTKSRESIRKNYKLWQSPWFAKNGGKVHLWTITFEDKIGKSTPSTGNKHYQVTPSSLWILPIVALKNIVSTKTIGFINDNWTLWTFCRSGDTWEHPVTPLNIPWVSCNLRKQRLNSIPNWRCETMEFNGVRHKMQKTENPSFSNTFFRKVL